MLEEEIVCNRWSELAGDLQTFSPQHYIKINKIRNNFDNIALAKKINKRFNKTRKIEWQGILNDK